MTLIALFCIYLYHRHERRKAARLYRQRKEKLAENKIQFLINIAHELRTPLTLLYAPLKKLLDKDGQNKDIRDDLSLMFSQTMNMMHLINLILDSRKLEEGYEHIALAPHDLNLWLGSVTDEFRKEYESKDIGLRFEPDPKIQSVNYDSSKFHIILSNLLMNAWKFSEPHTEVTVRTSAVEGMVRISVIDQGIGIKQSEIPFLFNRFTKADMKSNGFGLGLSYVKALVEAHPGGRVGAMPNRDKGATFWFEIPEHIPCSDCEIPRSDIIGNNSDNTAKEIRTQDDQTNEIDTSEFSILIAEDEADLLKFIARELDGHFRKILTASSGEEAYDIILQDSPDIFVSDVMMPETDGYELCRRIKNNAMTSRLPVILITAMNGHDSMSRVYRSGADLFLQKPFDIPTLLSAVKNILYSRMQLREQYRQLFSIDSISGSFLSNTDEEFVRKVNQCIAENISNDALNAQMLIDYMCMGRASFYKKFKRLIGLGVMEYVSGKRMAIAADLLKNTCLTVSEISFKVGYSDTNYFSTSFKKQFGQTPSRYRKNLSACPVR